MGTETTTVLESGYVSYARAALHFDCSIKTIRRLVDSGIVTPLWVTATMPRVRIADIERALREVHE